MVNLFVVPLVLILCSLCYSNYTYGKVKPEAIQRSYSVYGSSDQECTKNSHCSSAHSCSVFGKCLDPCLQSCGINATCEVISHNPVCSCGPDHYGDPIVGCLPISVYGSSPCQHSPCGPKAYCQVRGKSSVCSCLAHYVGEPPNCHPACTKNSQCSSALSCINRECLDPCLGACGVNATCKVINHNPVCSCGPNYSGDPFVSCLVISEPPPQKELRNCSSSETEVLGESKICKRKLLFHNDINDLNWKRSHFIASDPDYVFCSYQKRKDTFLIKDDEWIIKPIPFKSDSDVRGILDLRQGCTSDRETDCIMYQDGGFILPPVTSERIKTTRGFKYGTVEIRAKLPVGDWLYPEIYLQSSLSPAKKIWVAYARGNEHLIGNGSDDLGGTLLFGGPILNASEPERSKYLNSTRADKVFGSDYHTYSVIWEPKKISMLVDGVLYGESEENISSFFDEPMHLVLGIGVGGVTDFPDNYVSTNNKKKPWVNFERLQMKKFFNARDDWLPTWTDDGSCLKIKHVKIKAL